MEEGIGRTGASKSAGSKLLKIGALALLIAGLAWAVNASLPQTVESADVLGPSEKTLDEARRDLHASHAVQRAQGVVAIAHMQDTASLPTLRTMLQQDPSPVVQGVVAIALGQLKDTPSTVDIAAMLSQNKIAPDMLLDALGRMGDAAGASAVLPFLASDSDTLRLQAVDALVAMQAHAEGENILRLARVNTSTEKAKNFAVVLGKLKVASAQNYLIALAQKTPPSPTLSASYLALGRIASVDAIPVLTQAIGNGFSKGRENATEALLLIHSPQALAGMFPYLTHKDRDVRWSAAEIIAQIPDERSGPALLKILQTRHSDALAPAAYAVGRLKYQPAQNELATMLADRAAPDRKTLARALGWMGAHNRIALLRTVLLEPDGEGRLGAAWSLGVLGAVQAVDDLQQTANGRDPELAMLSLEALGMIHSEKSLAFLIQKAQSAPGLATQAMASIANIPGTSARLALEEFARHGDLRISRPALQGLAQRKEAQSIPALIGMMETAVPDNRRQVYFALSAVTGQKHDTASAWRNWYEKTRNP